MNIQVTDKLTEDLLDNCKKYGLDKSKITYMKDSKTPK